MKTYKIIFSPTGGTAAVADAITEKWSDAETIDLTCSNCDFNLSLEEDSLALIAMPSFGGIAPQLALERLSKICANNAKCAVAAVYGNRAYDDTLLQIKEYAEKAGFNVIAAVSAVAEHSIIRAYAAGRPDAADRNQLCGFGERIMEKAENGGSEIAVPGNKPYKKAGSAMVPKAGSACKACGLCAKNCPAGAIDAENLRKTDKNKCIGCMRCVAGCPSKARSVNPLMTKIAGMALKKACSEVKKNELFL